MSSAPVMFVQLPNELDNAAARRALDVGATPDEIWEYSQINAGRLYHYGLYRREGLTHAEVLLAQEALAPNVRAHTASGMLTWEEVLPGFIAGYAALRKLELTHEQVMAVFNGPVAALGYRARRANGATHEQALIP